MGTRGFLGFVADGREIITYNHWDSYPSGLGENVLEWLRVNVSAGNMTEVKESARNIKIVTDETPITDEDVSRLAAWSDMTVGGPSDSPMWYQLLRQTQGSPVDILASGYVEDASEFPRDSLFCEWGYLVDLDTEMFEVYEGFQEASHTEGRFGQRGKIEYEHRTSDYYPVKLVASWPFNELPGNDEFSEKLDRSDDD